MSDGGKGHGGDGGKGGPQAAGAAGAGGGGAKGGSSQLGVTPRATSFTDWYQDLVLKAQLADHSPVRGCMVVRPYGWALWERIRETFDRFFKETGHENAQFPLFIPLSFLAKEASHVEGFAKECAVVTHYRLKAGPNGIEPDPDSKLEEPLIVRPTSETIIGSMYAKWVQSWRDLPILINQWANVVRWEMRTRLFLRTTEFFWQEGHTAHETEKEAVAETLQMIEVYRRVAEEYLAMPVLVGRKSAAERFAGAVDTWCIEALMQDGKALQAGTSHFLGQNFAKAFEIQFAGRDGQRQHAWTTSWGVSTRLIGGLVMTHSDDKGLVLPPRLAPIQAVVIPIWRKDEEKAAVMSYVDGFVGKLKSAGVRVHVDDREHFKPGYKFNDWELRGVPLRLEVGPRDVAAAKCVMARRDGGEKQIVDVAGLETRLPALLEEIQAAMFAKAKAFRDASIHRAATYEELVKTLEEKGGFVLAPWDGDAAVEATIKEQCKATIRCIRDEDRGPEVPAIVTGTPTAQWVVFAKAY
ncbi:MAG: proline--tRNA ligase [Planctomycetes bacterium]|nr:proline--tRNA ligase [Planctomycetota bacterium]